MSDCAISKIEAGAFVDLVQLRWLDLSDNRLTSLSDATFAGLHLHQLFLNGNQRLALNVGRPFANLTVFGLYLHDCQLTRVDARTLAPLDGSLRVLWLSENRLSRLDPALGGLFRSLDHFRLTDNRLHCNCELSWLWRAYDEQRRRRGKDLMAEEAPECLSPASLRGRHFGELSDGDLRCSTPTLADVEVMLIDDDDDNDDDADAGQSSGRRSLVLRCTATGDPTPNVIWIKPSTSSSRLPPPTSSTKNDTVDDVGDAVLVLNDEDVQLTSLEDSTYTCVASNVVGNATVTVRQVLRMWNIAGDDENDELEIGPPYFDDNVAELTGVEDERRLLMHRNVVSSELNTSSAGGTDFTCIFSSVNGTDLFQSSSYYYHELCGGRDRRLRASSSLDGRRVQSSSSASDERQYGVKYLVAAIVVTVLLTAISAVAAVSVWLRRTGGISTCSGGGAELQHQQPVTVPDGASRPTVSATTSVCDTVVQLTRKPS